MPDTNIDYTLIEKSLNKSLSLIGDAYILQGTDKLEIALEKFNNYSKHLLVDVSKELEDNFVSEFDFVNADECYCDRYAHKIAMEKSFEINPSCEVKKSKKDIYLIPPSKKMPLDYVVQVYFRGRTAYTDIMIKTGKDRLIGWTILNMKPNAIKADVDSIATAKKYLKGYSFSGNKYFDSFLKPKNMLSRTIEERDPAWFNVGNLEIDEGESGTTSDKKGVLITVESGKVDYGMQLSYFHEYFLSGKKFFGQLRFTAIESDGREVERQEPIPEGETIWIANFSKEIKPYILTKRSVKKKAMPLDGTSGIPSSLMKDIPKKFKYWKEEDTSKSLQMRSELISSGIITKDSIQNVEGQYRVVHKKFYLGADTNVLDSDNFTDFELKEQCLINTDSSVVRKEFFLTFKDSSLPSVRFQSFQDKDNINNLVGFENHSFFGVEGQFDPQTQYNETQSLTAVIKTLDSGNIEYKRDPQDNVELCFNGAKIVGDYLMKREEPGSKYWIIVEKQIEDSTDTIEKIELENGLCCYDYIGKDLSSENLRPFSLFDPSNISISKKSLNEITSLYSKNPYKSIGYSVQPLEDGLRCVVQKSNDDYLGYHMDEDISFFDIKDEIKKSFDKLGSFLGDFIIDGILVSKKSSPKQEVLKDLDGNIQKEDYCFSILHIVSSQEMGMQNSAEQYLAVSKEFDSFDDNFLVFAPVKSFSGSDLKKIVKSLKKDFGYSDFLLKPENDAYNESSIDKWLAFKEHRFVNGVVLDKKSPDNRQKKFSYSIGLLAKDQNYHLGDNLVEVGKDLYVSAFKNIKSEIDFSVGDVVETSFKSCDCVIRKGLFTSMEAKGSEIRKTDATISSFEDLLSGLNEEELDVENIQIDHITVSKEVDEERYVLGIVLEPDILDGQNEVVSASTIRKACFHFMENYRKLGVYHIEENRGRLALLENFLAPVDFKLANRPIKKGTWLMGIRIMDDDLWEKVKSGAIKGLSIWGKARRLANKKKNIQVNNT
jgi:hypothetical protein